MRGKKEEATKSITIEVMKLMMFVMMTMIKKTICAFLIYVLFYPQKYILLYFWVPQKYNTASNK